MTRYNDVITLLAVINNGVDEYGNQKVKTTSKEVFANKYRMGLSAWAAAKSAGLHADAQFTVRSCDYAGESVCVADDTEYDVEKAVNKGEYTTLTLKRRLGND